jgi:hypothetical protein
MIDREGDLLSVGVWVKVLPYFGDPHFGVGG